MCYCYCWTVHLSAALLSGQLHVLSGTSDHPSHPDEAPGQRPKSENTMIAHFFVLNLIEYKVMFVSLQKHELIDVFR
jgi:hypothetical protein